MDLRESGWGKRICLVCGARLGEELRHLERPTREPVLVNGTIQWNGWSDTTNEPQPRAA